MLLTFTTGSDLAFVMIYYLLQLVNPVHCLLSFYVFFSKQTRIRSSMSMQFTQQFSSQELSTQ